MTFIDKLKLTANSYIEISKDLISNKNPEKQGGYLTVGLDGFLNKYVLEIGNYDIEKKEKYLRFSQEKAHRLYSDWLRDTDSISSWQTRQIEINRYGGAVLFGFLNNGIKSCNVFSFSGLNEHTDEAVSFMLAYTLNLANSSDLEQITRISKNQVLEEMFKKCK
ncbi:hypothetical protein HYS72_01785 [Candidatus Pacearchaeota archaeon]|nr:hypothetical protein [Candidatus Pacearchaeota archaeon]MBI2056695.1 hypothetical protein [Candidatus Pacearchaeota archaeon]